MKPLASATAAALLLIATTGCFRASSDTRALREAAVETGLQGVEHKFELGLGSLVLAPVRLAARFVELPPEGQMAATSLHGAECSIAEFDRRTRPLGDILAAADETMIRRGFERLVGVIDDQHLVAVYVPSTMRSAKNIQANVLVLDEHQLVCAGVRGDAREILQFAWAKAREEIPSRRAGEGVALN